VTYDIVAGTSDSLLFQLLEKGAPIDVSGLTVTLLLEDRTGTAVVSPGTILVTDSVNGKVQFTPTSALVFVAANGPYYARWVLTTSGGAASYVPTSNRDLWNVVGQ